MRRLRKFLKCLALTVGALIAVALVANAIYVWQSGNRLEERLSKLRAAGEPLSLPELGAMPTPPGADAAAVLKRIEPELRALSKEIMSLLDESEHPAPWPDETWKRVEKAYANHPTVLPALAEAAACPSYKSPLNYHLPTMPDSEKTTATFLDGMLSHAQTERETAYVLKCRVEIQLRAKDRDGAMRTCLDNLRIARHMQKEPMIVSYLVVTAVRSIGMEGANEVLRAGPVPADLHAELEAELAKADSADSYRWSLRSERAYTLQALAEMNGANWFLGGFWNDQKSFCLDQFTECIDQADDSYAKYQAERTSAEASPTDVVRSLARLVRLSILKSRVAVFRSRCQTRCLRVLNALTAKNLSEMPANLADLGLPASAVLDPYVDRPLIVKRVDGQWLVYGVGSNLKDDGGPAEKSDDVGYGPKRP